MKLRSNIYILPFFVLFIFSFINFDKEINDLSLSKNKNFVASRNEHSFGLISQKEIKTSSISKEIKFFESFESLFNHKLSGLSVIDENVIDPYKKYGLDFSTICFCNSTSIYIDTKNKNFIVFNYCDSDLPLKNIKNKSVFKISKIENDRDKIVITTAPNLKITFFKKDKLPIFYMTFKGAFPKQYVGSDLKKVFTSTPEKFQKEDCGDFDG